MPRIADLRKRSDALLVAPEGAALVDAAAREPRTFTPFLVDHLQAAIDLSDRLMATADEQGLAAAIEEAERASRIEPRDLFEWAWMLFLTHHPEGARLPIPGLEERHPEQFRTPGAALTEDAPDAVDPEQALAWYREDALANQHHEHWHVVYRRDSGNDRHGELFFYMHRQMLARYDAERLAVGLPPAKPLNDYRAPIAEGYRPNDPEFAERRPGTRLVDVTLDGRRHRIPEHESLRAKVRKAVRDNRFVGGQAVTPDLLGATVEPNDRSASRPGYQNHHGFGHVFIALVHSPSDTSRPGVMWDPRSAIMDPVFYRWHRHVDDFLFEWERRQRPNDFGDAPPVRLRDGLGGATTRHASPDVILAFTDRAPAGADLAAWGEQTFGGVHWDEDFAATDVTTAELQTEMKERQTPAGRLQYLDHRDFAYFLRLENPSGGDAEVTVRIFLAPVARAGERRGWMEMDKFRASVGAGRKVVLARRAALSSVVQKPASHTPHPRREPGRDAAANYCSCGWPFHLLVPRGTAEGMRFRLLVMVTDWNLDRVERDTPCGSMSFCGVRDSRYPDQRPMGYPFDRPFPNGIAAAVAAQPNMATRDITIRRVR